VSGPLPQPRPSPSNKRLHRIAFWNAIGESHHCAMWRSPPSPGVNPQKKIQRPTYTAILTAYVPYTATGEP